MSVPVSKNLVWRFRCKAVRSDFEFPEPFRVVQENAKCDGDSNSFGLVPGVELRS
jgi:hypothetical protein